MEHCSAVEITNLFQENSSLRAKVDWLLATLEEERSDFNKKRGAVEYELDEYRKRNAILAVENDNRFKELVRQNQSLMDEANELRATIEQYKINLQEESNRNAQIDTYLTGLPTKEEHADALRRLTLAQRHAADMEKKIEEINTKLEQYETKLSTSKIQLKRSEDREKVLQTQLNMAMQRLHSQSGANGLVGVRPQVTPEFVDDLHCELNHYRSSYEQVKKLLEAESHRAEATEARLEMTKRQFEEQLAREAAGITGLKTTLVTRQTEIRQLKTRITELNAEKQELLSQLLNTKSALSQSNSAWKSTEGTHRGRLLTILCQAVEELGRLSSQLTKIAEGQRPDLATLLFEPKPISDWSISTPYIDESSLSRNETVSGADYGSPLFPQSLGHQPLSLSDCDLRIQAERVQQVHEQLAELRKRLADRYAEHLGGKLECFVQ